MPAILTYNLPYIDRKRQPCGIPRGGKVLAAENVGGLITLYVLVEPHEPKEARWIYVAPENEAVPPDTRYVSTIHHDMFVMGALKPQRRAFHILEMADPPEAGDPAF